MASTSSTEDSPRPPVTMIPFPDPTERTTEQLRREISLLERSLDVQINAMREAVRLLQAQADKAPSIAEMYAKHEEMFRSIQTQFTERDTRTEQISTANKLAIDAALQAAKEAVGNTNESNAQSIAKSEAATTKQMDAINVLITASTKALDDKIGDLKDRVASFEAKGAGKAEGLSQVGSLILGAVSIIAVVVAVVSLLHSK